MRRNSLSKHWIALAILLALTLTLVFAGVSSAAPASALPALDSTVPCLSAGPATQTVSVGKPAVVDVKVGCYPSNLQFPAYLTTTWGDGATEMYPLCVEVCRVPPFVIAEAHIYNAAGDYFPKFCLTPVASSGSAPECTSVEVRVD